MARTLRGGFFISYRSAKIRRLPSGTHLPPPPPPPVGFPIPCRYARGMTNAADAADAHIVGLYGIDCELAVPGVPPGGELPGWPSALTDYIYMLRIKSRSSGMLVSTDS